MKLYVEIMNVKPYDFARKLDEAQMILIRYQSAGLSIQHGFG